MPGTATTARAEQRNCVLIVETDDVIRTALQFMLRGDNEVCTAAGLEQAYVRIEEWSPGLVLLGVGVVRERGLGAIAAIDAHAPGIRILLVADKLDEPVVRACLASGAHDVLGKPIGVGSVRRKVDTLLGRRAPEARAARKSSR